MKDSKFFKIWNIIYPIGIYYVVLFVMEFVCQFVVGTEQNEYVLRQLIATVVTIPIIASFYQKTQKRIHKEKSKAHLNLFLVIWILVVILCLSLSINNFICMSPLVEISDGYQNANAAFYAGAFLFELLGPGLFTPVLEELLFRGIVYEEAKEIFSKKVAIIFSAFVFAVLHFNIVQFVYSFLLGIVLILIMEKTKHLYGAILGHIVANMFAVIRNESGMFQDLTVVSAKAVSISGILLIIGGIVLLIGLKKPIDKRS